MMNDELSALAARELSYKELLEKLDGVYSARVTLDDAGEIEEVHALADAKCDVAKLMSAARVALSAGFGANVDHKLISVALIKESPQELARAHAAAPSMAQPPNRLRLGRLALVLEDDRFEVSLTLKSGGQVFPGDAHSRNSGPQRNMCVANATLSAVHRFLGEDNIFKLAGVQRITTEAVPMCMVMVEVGGPQKAMLVGTAELTFDEASCVEKATLNAVNRKLTALAEAVPEVR